MIQFADFGVNGKMNARSGKLMVQVLFLLLLTDLAFSEPNDRTPARILAKQTGAAQFEEHIEQPIHYDCNEHHHRLRKRSSDEDLDYEVYQGVVGRPGIDFPIFPRIPQTTFSCRSYGNGYFTDLEAGCQVFHICEEGRKISFLCPNGTIFQQSELTCDWWFKVNCAGSPSFYAESAELLNKARRQRVKPTPQHKAYTNRNKVTAITPTRKSYKGSERRIDSNENPSVESLDFDDISDDRSNDRSHDRSNDKLKLQKEKLLTHTAPEDHHHHHHNEQHELQITAETSSFVKDPRRNSYGGADKTLNKEREFISDKPSDKGRDIPTPKDQSIIRNNQRNDYNEKQKTGKKIDDDKSAGFYVTSRPDISHPPTPGKGSYFTTSQPESYSPRNSLDDSAVGDKQLQFVTPETEDRHSHGTYSTIKPDFFGNGPILKSATTPSSYPGTYSTARRIDSTRTTPFYTPTVPSVIRTKPTESKSFYVNVAKSDEPTTLRGAVTTENATPRPVIIGMRRDNSEIHRFPVFSNGDLKVQLPVLSVEAPRLEGLSLTTSTSGPTYLPKGTESNKIQPVTPASIENSVSRNIKGILQTVGAIKETMKSNLKDKNSSSRIGLDIPPSSGPGALVSLTNYFANDEQITSTVSSEEDTQTQTTPSPSAASPSVDISAGLLSNKTSGKYLSLFGLNQNDSETDNLPAPTTPIPKNVYPPTAIGDFTRTTIRDLAQNPETRKIAQVFSNAITKYIENPETFRKDLIGVRPTQPTRKPVSITEEVYTTPSSYFNRGGTVTVSILTDDTTERPGIKKGSVQTYQPTTTEKYDTTTSPTTESNDIAREINNQFDISTPAYDSVSTESTEATTYRGSSFSTSRPKPYLDVSLSSELLPPSLDEEHEHESLHKVQSQSFVKSFNDLSKAPKAISFDKSRNTFDTSDDKDKVNPWLHSQKEKATRTESPWTHSAITQTEGKSNFDSATEQALTTTDSTWTQTDKGQGRKRVDSSTDTVAAPEQTPRTHQGKNRVNTSTDTAATTESPEDQTPWKSDDDTSTETVTTTGRLQEQPQGRNKFETSTGTGITTGTSRNQIDSSTGTGTTTETPQDQSQQSKNKFGAPTGTGTATGTGINKLDSPTVTGSTSGRTPDQNPWTQQGKNKFGAPTGTGTATGTGINKLDSPTVTGSTSGRTPDQNPWTQQGKNKFGAPSGTGTTTGTDINTFDTSTGTGTTTGRTQDQNPWTQQGKNKFGASTGTGINKFDTSTGTGKTTGRTQDQTARTQQDKNKFNAPTGTVIETGTGKNKFNTSPGTDTRTGTLEDQKDKSTEYPWTHPNIPPLPIRSSVDTSVEKLTTESPRTHSKQPQTSDKNGFNTSPENPWIHSNTPPKKPVKGGFETSAERVTTSGNPWLHNKKQKPTENPWSQITHSIYLDPLTINDGLMRELKTTTLSPIYSVNTDRSRFEDASQDEEDLDDILNSPELSEELLPRNNGLQRIANKLFGGLNETEAVHLKNVMKKAEHNQNVLRLLLLLIQACDDQNGKSVEKSRKILLNALIGMDGKIKSKNIDQMTATTTNKIPVTTYRRIYSESTTTVRSPTTTTETTSSNEGTTKFEILVPDPEDEDDSNVTTTTVSSERQPKVYDNPNRTSDERALELLKSLYSLASKFSRR